MTDNSEKTKPQRSAALKALADAFPVIRNCQPLAIGIHKTIKERQPELNDGALRFAMRQHTASTKYLKAISSGTQRFDLDGNPAGEITAEQRQQALDALKERFRKGAERKREEQQQKEHQEKLQKLAEKFNRR